MSEHSSFVVKVVCENGHIYEISRDKADQIVKPMFLERLDKGYINTVPIKAEDCGQCKAWLDILRA